MKNTACILMLVFAVTAPAAAAEKLWVKWSNLGYYLEGHQVTVTNDGPREFKGKCLRVDYSGLIFEDPKGGRPQLLQRAKVQHIKVTDLGGRQMARLINRTGPALNYGRKMTFSPGTPVGLVVTPIVGAYIVASTPFCLLGDLVSLLKPALEIEVDSGPLPVVQ